MKTSSSTRLKLICVSAALSLIFVVLALNYVYAVNQDTNGFNWAGGRQSAANFSSVLQAIGADETVCATAGTSAVTQQFDNFGFTIHPSAVIHGIRVSVKGSISAGSDTWTVFLRKNETGEISSVKPTASVTNTAVCGATQEVLVYGNLTGTFGQTWSASELDDDGFTVGISLPAVGAGTRRINWIKVEVEYSLPTTTTTVTSTTTITQTVTSTITNTATSTITAATCLGCSSGGGSTAIYAAIIIALIVAVAVAASKR